MGAPKTEAGRRFVAVPPHILPCLTQHLAEHVGADAESPVLTGERGARVRPAALQSAWTSRGSTLADQTYTFLTCATLGNSLAATTGANLRELMVTMGHASPDAALRYLHATEDRDAVIAKMKSGAEAS